MLIICQTHETLRCCCNWIGTSGERHLQMKNFARQGLKTAIIERRFIGGTCINDGCTPTKTMVASARMMHLAKKSAALGVTIKDVQLNYKKVIERKRIK